MLNQRDFFIYWSTFKKRLKLFFNIYKFIFYKFIDTIQPARITKFKYTTDHNKF